VEKVNHIKQAPGPDLHGYGSANLVQTLMKHDVVDEFWLKIYPLTLGSGKRLFVEGTIPSPADFRQCMEVCELDSHVSRRFPTIHLKNGSCSFPVENLNRSQGTGK
jgi:dihydrofolate reductase